MAGSSTLTSSVEQRGDTLNKHPIWERVITYTYTVDGGDAEVKHVLSINGILQKIIVKVGSDFNSGTVNFAIDDNGDNEIFAVTSLAESSTSVYDVSEPICGDMDIGIDPSDDPASASSTVVVTLRGI